MKFLNVLLQCFKVYFVYKKLKKKGLIRTDYALCDVLMTGLKHVDELEKLEKI